MVSHSIVLFIDVARVRVLSLSLSLPLPLWQRRVTDCTQSVICSVLVLFFFGTIDDAKTELFALRRNVSSSTFKIPHESEWVSEFGRNEELNWIIASIYPSTSVANSNNGHCENEASSMPSTETEWIRDRITAIPHIFIEWWIQTHRTPLNVLWWARNG